MADRDAPVPAVSFFIDLKCFKFLRWNSMTITTQQSNHYSIQEASRIVGLPESTLRYYESIGVLDPVSRDASSGHRRYTDRDIDAAISIACLSATGLSIQKMRAYLANRKAGATAAHGQIELLEQHQRLVATEVRLLQLRQEYLAVKVEYWRAVRDQDPARASELTHQAGEIAVRLREQQHTQEAAA